MSEYFDADGEPTVLGRARDRYGSDARGGWPDPHRRRSFDAALAAHDRKVKAAVLREMAEDWMPSDPVSHRFRNWLRDTADLIESEARP